MQAGVRCMGRRGEGCLFLRVGRRDGREEEAAAFRAKVSSGPRSVHILQPAQTPALSMHCPLSLLQTKTLSTMKSQNLLPSLPCTPGSPAPLPPLQCPFPQPQAPFSWPLLSTVPTVFQSPPPTLMSPLPRLEHKRKKAEGFCLGPGRRLTRQLGQASRRKEVP